MGTTSNTSSLASNAQSDIPRGRLLHLNCNRFRGFLLAVVQSFLAAGFVLCILILIPKVIITFAIKCCVPNMLLTKYRQCASFICTVVQWQWISKYIFMAHTRGKSFVFSLITCCPYRQSTITLPNQNEVCTVKSE